MTFNALSQLVIYLLILGLLSIPLGRYIACIFTDQPAGLNRLGRPLEHGIYRLCGIRPQQAMSWIQYALAVLLVNLLGAFAVYALQRLQFWLPLNPQHFPAVSADSALNTAISFVTNTNWQGYSGETTMSYLTQMLGLTVQNFVSAASAMAVLLALIRGFTQHSATTIGNFWVDITRILLYVLLPLALVLAIVFMSQGIIQNFKSYQTIHSLEPSPAPSILPMGPVASQEAIKILGTNGGGFFNANSAHPFENPTPLTNFLQMLMILLIPAALCQTFGLLVGDTRQGWVIFAAMAVLFIIMAGVAMHYEQRGNPLLTALAIDQTPTPLQSGGNMEGKETRFGATGSALYAVIATASSCGAVNSMHDSYTPLGGLVPLWLMQLGEVIFGGIGSGLYGMLLFAILAVFIAGLMIGRTPEYLGKKIESFEMKMTAIAILITPLLVLLGTAIAATLPAGMAGITNLGPHGFSEILYALSSASNNNGSAFAGLAANTPFYNILLAIVMWFGRFWTMLPVLAIAGSLANKKKLTASRGTLPTHGPLFVALLVGTVILIGALTYLPALALGPIAEHFMLP